ncbi:uncharacterized protein TrAtP1_011721 [Trichoderma atroviride]|uniref:uncharacterized protein n=1 Tax=Hypocrea atroviridis TaxID=63577 RepID=UPI0033329198|nr:hypothetical protein TrAtP1_011721 [Trichoderma atroviride]
MQKQCFDLDPLGDVLLTLRCPNQLDLSWRSLIFAKPRKSAEGSDESESRPKSNAPTASVDEPNAHDETEDVQFLLSSRHLSLASPVFGTMLSGGWKESTVLIERPRKIARLENSYTTNSESQPRHQITATEWNTEAFLLLMNIIHGHHRKVPQKVDLETLAHFSILVDYYKCQEITEVFARIWIEKLAPSLPRSHCPPSMIWIFVSWVFSNASIFEKMTELALKGSQGPLETLCLPLPSVVLDAFEEKRTSSLQKMMHAVDEFRNGLLNSSIGCDLACTCMLLGALIKQSDRLIHGQHVQRSIKQVKLDFQGFETPAWGSLDSRGRATRHDCSIASQLMPAVDKVWYNLKGLKSDDYRVQKENEVPKV